MTDGNDLTYSAFISYASADRDKAEAICQSLESRGFRCWIAPRDLRAGREYGEEIIYGIGSSRCLVLVLSESANESTFVRREVERAVSKRKPVFPVRIEEVMPSPGLELFVSTTHWIDAWSGPLSGHVERLARDMNDESVVAQARQNSARVVRRRQLPRWIASAGAILLIAAVVALVNVMTRSNPSGESDHDPFEWDMAGTDRQMIEATGVDPASITAKDIIVTLDIDEGSDGAEVHIQRSADMKKLADYATLYLAIGEGEFQQHDYGGTDRIYSFNIDQAALAQAKSIRLRYDLQDGQTIGPFTYEVSLGNSLRLSYKQRALDSRDWDTNSSVFRSRLSLFGIQEFWPAVKAIHFGEHPDRLDRSLTFDLPRGFISEQQFRDGQEAHALENIPLRPGSEAIYVQLEFFDGTRSDTRHFGLEHDDMYFVVGRQLDPVDMPEDAEPLLLFLGYEAGNNNFTYAPAVPIGATEVRFSFDEEGLFPAESSSEHTPLRRFGFNGPLRSGLVRVSYTQADGMTVGPFRYRFDPRPIIAEALQGQFRTFMRDAITCCRIQRTWPPNKSSERTFGELASHNKFTLMLRIEGVPNADFTAPSTICFPTSSRRMGEMDGPWASVTEVRIGTSPDQLDIVRRLKADVLDAVDPVPPMTFDDLGLTDWIEVLPVDAKAVYVQYKFLDGEQSEVIRLKISER